MDANRRTPHLRRVATTASLAALILVPAGQAQAARPGPKPPVILSVSPLTATVGQTLTIKGLHFRTGKGRNSVGFKRDGAAVVFVRSALSTQKTMTVRVSSKLDAVLKGSPAQFHLRILARRFGTAYTADRLSPMIKPKPAPVTTAPDPTLTPTPTPVPTVAPEPVAEDGDCDGDGIKNSQETDADGDLLPDTLENKIGTDGCKADTDGDGISDGYEYRSGIDLNDDEYQTPQTTLVYPGDLGYPNPIEKDAGVDYDGDGLNMKTEYDLWRKLTPPGQRTLEDVAGKATPLSYSDGLQYSISRRCVAGDTQPECQGPHEGRRVPTLRADNYDKFLNFKNWLEASGYAIVYLNDSPRWFDHGAGRFAYSIFDTDRDGKVSAIEDSSLDRDNNGYLSDDERDEDADGLSNVTEIRGALTTGYWTACYTAEAPYPVPYAGTDAANPDTDGDGIRDGADDQDHDDVPNIMELSRFAASAYQFNDTDDGIKDSLTGGRIPEKQCQADPDLAPDAAQHADAFGKVNPFNPCDPDPQSRTCQRSVEIGSKPGPNWWALQ